MAKNSIRQYDLTAANNLDVAGISLAEGVTKPSDVNNIERAEMSHLAQYLTEMSYPTVGGTADALTLTPTTALAALADNVVYTGTIGASPNATTTPTLTVSGLATKNIRKMSGGTDVAVAIGDLAALTQYVFVYKAAANSAVGAWIVLNTQFPGVSTPAITAVASATTTNIGAAATSTVNITGTTTITAFDTVAAGTIREGYFSGALTLTHNASSLIIPGGLSILTAANDRFRAMSLGSGNWIILYYIPADGSLVLEQSVSSIASATTTNIAGSGVSRYVSITGTTTITSFGTFAAGHVVDGTFTGILTLTYNASSLILPGAASITTAAGDTFRAVSLGSGNWRVTNYTKADGTAVVASAGRTLLATLTTTSGSTQTTGTLATTYTSLEIEFNGVGSSSSVAVSVNISSDGGSTFDTAVVVTAASTSPFFGRLWIGRANVTSNKDLAFATATAVATFALSGGAGFTTKTSPTNCIRLSSAGTFNAGTAYVYGVP